MNEAEARARLEAMVAADEEPALSFQEIAALLAMSKLVDAYGRAPSDPAWEPTWDLNRGAAEGWRWKAAKLAARYDFDADGQSFQRSQAFEHCERMAEMYRRRIVSSARMQGWLAGSVNDG